MTEPEEDLMSAEARGDFKLLIKEYAHVGYARIHGLEDEGFEALWRKAFPDAHEEKPVIRGASL